MIQIKLQHEHGQFDCHPRKQNQNQFQNSSPQILQQPKIQQKVRRIKINSTANLDNSEYFLSDSLIPFLQQSLSLLTNVQFEQISKTRKNLQLFVYTSLVEDEKDYLERLYKIQNKSQNFIHEVIKYQNQLITQTIVKVNDQVLNQILLGQHNVHKIARPTKQDIFGGVKATQAVIKIRQQMLKAQLSSLKQSINTGDDFAQSQVNQKAKQAKQFVRRMQIIQQQHKKQRQLKQQILKRKMVEEEEQKKQIEQRIRNEKKQLLKMQIESKKQRKKQQRSQQQIKNAQFKQFLQQFKNKVPLFKRRQKQFFEKFVVPQNNKKLQILKQIREDRKSLSYQQLKQHEKQYLQIKQDHLYEKNASRAVQQKTKKPDKNYFKSKFHSLIQKQQKQKQQTQKLQEHQEQIVNYKKRFDYYNQIKTKYEPKIDPKKRQQAIKTKQQLSWVERLRANRSLNIDNYKKEGKNNLDKLHKYIAELKAKGKIINTSRTIQSSPQPNSARYINYLQQLRQPTLSQIHNPRSHSIDLSSINDSAEDVQRIKINLRKKQQTALRREQYIANLGTNNLDRFMEQKKKIDDDYLESARAKLAILNKFQ